MRSRLTRWKLTSPFLKCPKCGEPSRFVFIGRWKRQLRRDADGDFGVPRARVPKMPEEPEGGEDA